MDNPQLCSRYHPHGCVRCPTETLQNRGLSLIPAGFVLPVLLMMAVAQLALGSSLSNSSITVTIGGVSCTSSFSNVGVSPAVSSSPCSPNPDVNVVGRGDITLRPLSVGASFVLETPNVTSADLAYNYGVSMSGQFSDVWHFGGTEPQPAKIVHFFETTWGSIGTFGGATAEGFLNGTGWTDGYSCSAGFWIGTGQVHGYSYASSCSADAIIPYGSTEIDISTSGSFQFSMSLAGATLGTKSGAGPGNGPVLGMPSISITDLGGNPLPFPDYTDSGYIVTATGYQSPAPEPGSIGLCALAIGVWLTSRGNVSSLCFKKN